MLSKDLIRELEMIVGDENVLAERAEVLVYECDGLTFHKVPPDAVVFVDSAEQVAAVVRLAHRERIPFLARGAGTGLSGGAVPVEGGIIIEMSRMNRILKVDLENRFVVVEPGLVNLQLTKAVSRYGYHYAPDPSSQMACTIGGNIAENAGGPHCLKYGMTTNHVLALEVVLPDGEIYQLGSPTADFPGYDLVGTFVGSEGTFGIVTKAWLKLTCNPQAVKTMYAAFHSIQDATDATSAIIGAGIIPAALEIMDGLAIRMVEESIYSVGYPKEADAILIVEIDGLAAGLDIWTERIKEICRRHNAFQIQVARDEQQRARIWAGRKGAFGAAGRLSTNIYLADTVVPRTKLSSVMRQVYDIAGRYSIKVANVFHAGDGNLHPVFVYNSKDKDEMDRVLKACEEVVKISVGAGGVLSGEHGIGYEKKDFMSLIFTPDDLEAMRKVREVFNPDGLCNPGKVFPSGHAASGEVSAIEKLDRQGYDFTRPEREFPGK